MKKCEDFESDKNRSNSGKCEDCKWYNPDIESECSIIGKDEDFYYNEF